MAENKGRKEGKDQVHLCGGLRHAMCLLPSESSEVAISFLVLVPREAKVLLAFSYFCWDFVITLVATGMHMYVYLFVCVIGDTSESRVNCPSRK